MAIALVKSAKGLSATAITAPAFGSATTSGNLIVLAFTSDAYNTTPDAGWTESTGMEQSANHGGYIWWRISAGETSFQYTIGGAFNTAWVLQEFSGVAASPYDISAGQFANSSALLYTTPSITPTAGNRLLVASIGGTVTAGNASGTYGSWLNSFTAIDNNGQASGSAQCTGTAYRLVAANGSTAYSSGATYNTVGTPSTRSGLIIAFKESSLATLVVTGAQTLTAATTAGTISTAAGGGGGGGELLSRGSDGGGGVYFAGNDDDDRGTRASRKRRKKFLEDRARRVREL